MAKKARKEIREHVNQADCWCEVDRPEKFKPLNVVDKKTIAAKARKAKAGGRDGKK